MATGCEAGTTDRSGVSCTRLGMRKVAGRPMNAEGEIRLALPGKGTLESATLAFLAECGMKVNRNNPRQYLASVSSMPELEIVSQRAADLPLLVQDGEASCGTTGYDIMAEYRGTAERG